MIAKGPCKRGTNLRLNISLTAIYFLSKPSKFQIIKHMKIARIRALMVPSILSISCLIFISHLQGDVPAWRGNHNGTYEVQSAPTDWANNQLFAVPLESKSNGTPILVGKRLILTAEPDKLICVDSRSGAVLWERQNDLYTLRGVSDTKKAELETHRADIRNFTQQSGRLRTEIRRLEKVIEKNAENTVAAESKVQKEAERSALEEKIKELRSQPFYKDYDMPPAHMTNGYTSYSPHFDGKRIYAQFGFGVVVAYDLDGNRLWTSFMEHPDHYWGGSTMPQVVDDKLIIRFDDYIALDPATGKKLWNTDSEVVFGTPVPFEINGEWFLFTPRGEVLRNEDGEVLQDDLVKINRDRAWGIFNTPALVNGVIYASNGMNNEEGHVYAYKVPNTVRSLERNGLELLWHTDVAQERYYSSPLVYDGLIYVVGHESTVTVLEAESGKIVYSHKILGVSGTAYPTVVEADGKIYQSTEDGDVVIYKSGRTFEEISRHNVGPFRSTPIFSGERAYVRTYEILMAIGGKESVRSL